MVEPGRDVFGGHRLAGDVEQRMDLRDRAVNAPHLAHFAPMHDDPLDRGRQFFVYVCIFLS